MNDSLAMHEAFVHGDVEAIRALLGAPPDFPNTPGQMRIGNLLVYAIYWSPLAAVRALLELGADARHEADDGFPPLIAVTDRRARDGVDDRVRCCGCCLSVRRPQPARAERRHAAPPGGLEARWLARPPQRVRVLLAHGADPHLQTRIDDCRSALEDAETVGATELAALLAGGHQV